MKKDYLILGGIAVAAFLLLGNRGGQAKEGSESGGFQLPTVFPSNVGTSPGTSTGGGGNTYNISFPGFGGFPASDATATTKKEMAPVLTRTPGGFGYTYQPVAVLPGGIRAPTLAEGIMNVSPNMMTAQPANPAAFQPYTKKSGGGSSTYSPSGGSLLGRTTTTTKLAGSTTGMKKSVTITAGKKTSSGFSGKW